MSGFIALTLAKISGDQSLIAYVTWRYERFSEFSKTSVFSQADRVLLVGFTANHGLDVPGIYESKLFGFEPYILKTFVGSAP